MSLDFTVSERQSLSSSFRAAEVKNLLARRLTIPPHPEWALPEQINWRSDPFKDRNWRLQLHMLRWLEPLRHAAARGNDRAFDMWLHYVRDWVKSNPPEKPASGWAWKDMADGIRALQFCMAAPLVRDRSPDDLEWLEASIRTHATRLADPAHMGIANHALHQQEALFVCGRILGDEGLWKLAVSRMGTLLEEQYDPQGMNAEGAVAYHYNNYIWWERALKPLDIEGIKRPSGAVRHLAAPEGIAHATRPDGTFVQIGDTDSGTPAAIRSPATDYVSSAGKTGSAPADLAKVYDAGYIFCRSGWGETERNLDEETYFSISFGSALRVHGHPDGGSLTYSADTVNWLVDPGKFQYGTSVPRDHFFSRASHSLVNINGREPKKDATVSLLRRASTPRYHDFLFNDDSFDGIRLTRRVVYSVSGEYLVVVDQVNSQTECTGVQRWQLGPGVQTQVSRHLVELTSGDHRASLSFSGTRTTLEAINGQTDPFDGWVSTGWKQKEAATAILATKTGTKFRFITVLASGKDTHPQIVTHQGTRPGEFCLQVDTGKVSEYILVGSDSVSFPPSPPQQSRPKDTPPSSPVRRSRTGRPHHLDSSSRTEVFDLLEDRRNQGFHSSPDRRSEIAFDLQHEAITRGLVDDIDLGLGAGIADLSQAIPNRENTKLISPHRSALVNWDNKPDWYPTFYSMPVLSHDRHFSPNLGISGASIQTVPAGPLTLPFAVVPATGDTLTVLFQGAINRARIRTPIFQRLRYQVELDAGPTIVFSDPTLDLSSSMGLGWHLGTERTDLVHVITDTISRVAEWLNVQNIVLAGSSGGGFTALQVGSRIPDAFVVAISPQVDLRNYSTRLAKAALVPAFGSIKPPSSGHLVKRVSVPDRMRSLRTFPRTTLVSNIGDEHHRTEHESLLRASYEAAGVAGRLETIDIDLGPGHRAPNNDVYGNLMARIYETI